MRNHAIADALILAAGLGRRLRPLTNVRAKPAIPVAGEPMIRRTLAWLAARNIRRVVINLHHRPDTLTAVVGDARDLGSRVRYSWEQPRILGSAGGPRQALGILGVETFLLVNGDTLTDVDVEAMTDEHLTSGALVTLALVPNREPGRYGGVEVDDAGRVTRFVRRGPDAEDSWHFVGVQVVDARAFAGLAAGVPADSIGGVYDDLIRTRAGAVRGFRCSASFWDVGTPADYWRTSQAFADRAGAAALPGVGASIDPSAQVTRSILWDDVRVGAGARLDECILTDGVRVPDGSAYHRAILVRHGGTGGLEASPLLLD